MAEGASLSLLKQMGLPHPHANQPNQSNLTAQIKKQLAKKSFIEQLG
jgi:hypothetical protein